MQVGVGPAHLAKLLSNSPQLLALSVEANLRPKLKYLRHEASRDKLISPSIHSIINT